MKAFVTGGTGFIGRRVIDKLLERGYDVYALVRNPAAARDLQAKGVHLVEGNINYRESMRSAMQGSDVVFHIAGWYQLGSRDQSQAERINVDGTRNVLGLAHELGVPRIVYTSTVGVFGDTKGALVDESYRMPADQPFLTEYERTKWKAHYEVALPLIEQGAPVIIVQPGGVYGPGDPSLIGEMMRAFLRGMFSILPGPEMALTYAHVDDVAEGHILAAEKGKIGESYILAGPAIPLGEMLQIWAEVTGRPAPVASIPARYLKPFAPLLEVIGHYVPLPPLISRDAVAVLDATYGGRANKAHRELGWGTRSLVEGMRQTFAEMAEQEASRRAQVAPPSARKRQAAGIILAAGLVLLAVWLLSRRKK